MAGAATLQRNRESNNSELRLVKKETAPAGANNAAGNKVPNRNSAEDWVESSFGKLNDRGRDSQPDQYNNRRFSKLEQYNHDLVGADNG